MSAVKPQKGPDTVLTPFSGWPDTFFWLALA
jgi:hypothetical protein